MPSLIVNKAKDATFHIRVLFNVPFILYNKNKNTYYLMNLMELG